MNSFTSPYDFRKCCLSFFHLNTKSVRKYIHCNNDFKEIRLLLADLASPLAMPGTPSSEQRPASTQKEAGARGRDGEQLQHTLWQQGVHPGGHLPTGMEMELEAGISGAAQGQGLAGLMPWPAAAGSPSRSLQMP